MPGDVLVGSWVRGQVHGWKESRVGNGSAPSLEGIPLHVYGVLGVLPSHAGEEDTYLISGFPVEPASVRPWPPQESYPRKDYLPRQERGVLVRLPRIAER